MSKTARILAVVSMIAGLLSVAAHAEGPAAPPPPAGSPPPGNAPGPRIKFESPVFDFGKIKSGDVVKHIYIFTNAGDTVLEVTHVQPSCGCTTAGEWTRQVEPGATGSIPVQFNSLNFNGQVYKTVTVTCNDQTQPTIVLQLKGMIWKPIDVTPQYAVMTIPPDATTASTVVRIMNNTDEPLDILSEPESNNKSFTGTLVTNQPGKEYQLTITAVPPITSGTVQSQITIKTSSTNAPVITVPFYANLQPAVVTSPAQIVLPAAPLAAKAEHKIAIQCNGTNFMTLSDPAISAPGVDYVIKELQPGKLFEVTLSFPQGFELKPGQPALFTARCSHPKQQEIRVPILQMPRPAVMGSAPPMPAVPQRPAPTAAAVPPAPTAPLPPLLQNPAIR